MGGGVFAVVLVDGGVFIRMTLYTCKYYTYTHSVCVFTIVMVVRGGYTGCVFAVVVGCVKSAVQGVCLYARMRHVCGMCAIPIHTCQYSIQHGDDGHGVDTHYTQKHNHTTQPHNTIHIVFFSYTLFHNTHTHCFLYSFTVPHCFPFTDHLV